MKREQLHPHWYCNIPYHHLLVSNITQLLAQVDPYDLICASRDEHEYVTMTPELGFAVITHNVTREAVNSAFERGFGDDYLPSPHDVTAILKGLRDIRELWLSWQEK